MCTFDAPIARCEVMRTMVITDQTQHQCAVEHGCSGDVKCPLGACFTGEEVPPAVTKPPDAASHGGWRIAA